MSTRTAKGQAALERRIRSFYKHLNQQNVAACYQMIDPQVRDRPDSVTLYQYGSALHEFMDRVGPLKLLAVHVTLHADEPSQLYQGRDFGIGKATLADSEGNQYVFQERWVRQGRGWYTRSTGLVTPLPRIALSDHEASQ